MKQIISRTLLMFLMLGLRAVWAQDLLIKNTLAFTNRLESARPGDALVLKQGVYTGQFIVNKSLSITCQKGAMFDGLGQGNGITLSAPNIKLSGCHFTNWGDSLGAMNAGIYATAKATNVKIEDNRLNGDAFGILLDDVLNAKVYRNQIEGNLKLRSQDRGNGIHIYNNRGADVAFNTIWHTRDGIYIETSNGNKLRHNEMHDLRYGIHYMYSYSNLIQGNYTHHTRTGYALMQSKFLKVIDNRSDGDQNYGMLLNFVTRSTFSGNQLLNVQQGVDPGNKRLIQGAEGKALFVYNSLFNTFTKNRFENSGIGIHLTAGSEDNAFYKNQFINYYTRNVINNYYYRRNFIHNYYFHQNFNF